MRILFSLTYYTPYISGLTLYVRNLAEELSRRGHEVTVLCMRHERGLPSEETVGGVRIIRATPLLAVSKGFVSIDWSVHAFRLCRRAEAIIVNLPQAEGVIPSLFAKAFGKRLIATYHCEISLPATVTNRIAEIVLRLSHSISLHLANTVITYTKDFGTHARELKNFIAKSVYIYPPVVYPHLDNRLQKMIKVKIGPNRGPVIGMAARLAAEKGIEVVLQAIPYIIAKLPRGDRLKIIIAGPKNPVGEETYRRRIEGMVGSLGDRVIFLGSIPPEKMGSFYREIDMLALPSLNSTESFGMVQVEAMHDGVPVVASDLPGVRVPIAVTGMGRTVPAGDIRSFARAAVDVLSNKQRYHRNRRAIERTFSVSAAADCYERVIHTQHAA